MSCQNTPTSRGCFGPGTDALCDFCWDLEQQQSGGKATRERPKPIFATAPTKTTAPVGKSGGKPLPPLPLRRVVPVSKPPVGLVPMNPTQAKTLIAKSATAVVPIVAKKPTELPCQKKALPKPPPPQLVRLDVERACGGPGAWWQVVDAVKTVGVKAVTRPDRANVWSQLNWGGNTTDVSRAAAGPQNVSCQLGSDPAQSVRIDVYDIGPLAVSGGYVGASGKLYAWNDDVVVTATTTPNQATVWNLLQWNAQGQPPNPPPAVLKAGAHPNERKVSQAKAGDIKVSATLGCDPALGQKTVETTLHICKWPVLEVEELGFDGGQVLNDGAAEIGQPFDKKWIKGRPKPATNQSVTVSQSPLLYAAGSPMKLWAKFTVVEKPTEDETLWICGQATVKGKTLEWKKKITVRAGDNKVTTPVITSTGDTLPAEVGKFDPFTIEWYMTEPDNTTWRHIGTTTHLLYVTLGVPQKVAYWTLLEISCVAAAGTSTENSFVAAAFAPFKTHVGDGNGFRRQGDGVELSYYKDGVETDGQTTHLGTPVPVHLQPYSTVGILGRPDGTGRCGGWGDLLLHMFAIHGVTSANDYKIIRPKVSGAADYYNRFLVKNCTFTKKGKLKNYLPYTHRGHIDCVKQTGVRGQGKDNPQFDFGDHVFVEHNGQFYDPSYGIGPIVGQCKYEEDAIDGLGTYHHPTGYRETFTQAGTPQHIPKACCRGYFEFTISNTNTIVVIAQKFGKKASKLFGHDLNKALKKRRKKIKHLQAGDVVLVPLEWKRAGVDVMLYGYR
jgi:hypothetical protein